MGVLGALTIRIVGDLTQFNKDIASIQKKLNKETKGLQTVAKSMTTIGDNLTKSVTLPVVGISVAAIKTAADFETSMRNVNSIANLSEQEFAKMSDEVVKLSKKLPQSAKTLADGLYDISSSGFAGADGLKVLEASAKAASAGMTDTQTSAKGITAVLNAYGLEAEDAAKISDTMFRTVDKGVITFEELSGGIGNVLSTANLAGIEFNELSGMIGYMTTKGVSADETMTALNRLILDIIKPSEELAEVLYNAGYESGEMALKAEGLTGVLTLMEEASGGSLTELQKLSPEMRALKASGALLGGGIEELNDYMGDFKDTVGSTNIALEEQSKSLQFQLDILKNNLIAVGIDLGDIFIPAIKDAIKAITPLLDNIAKMPDETKKAIVGFGLFVAAIFPALSITGRMITSVIGLRTAIGTLKVAMAGTFGISSAIGFGVIGFFVNLGSVIYGLYNTINKFRDGTANWVDDWYRLAYPMIPVLEKLLGIDKETKNASQSFEHLTGYLTAAKTAMHQGRVATNDLVEAERILTETTEEAGKSTEELFNELFNLYNLEQSVTEASWKFEDAIANLTKVQKDANATERDKKAAVFETQDAYEEYINKMNEAYEADETNIWQKRRIQQEFVESTLKAIEYGAMTKEQAEKAAAAFGLSADEMIIMAGNLGLKLDEATQERYIEIKHNMKEVESDVDKLYKKLSDIDGMNVTFKMVQTGLMGWASGGIIGYKEGGIINKVLSASSGMITPSYDNGGILSLLHKNEVVLNSGQQRNLAELIFGLANTKHDVSSQSGITQNITINSPKPLTESEFTRQIDLLNRELGIRLGIS